MDLRKLFRTGREPGLRDAERLLTVRVDGQEVTSVRRKDIPCELTPDVPLRGPVTVEFEDAVGTVHRHHPPGAGGWLHLSVRVNPDLSCQADAVITDRPTHEHGVPISESETGVRFQPFFLAGAPNPPALKGRGLFARGLHFSGLVTPGNILLSCECDYCARTFVVRSFHAGFGEIGYFYSASGRYTLLVDARVPGAPVPLSDPEPDELGALEARLPLAPDGTRYAYLNPFRCPHCNAPYIDFTMYPKQRAGEYYGLYFQETPLIRFEGNAGNAA